jgi:hypothetical protein
MLLPRRTMVSISYDPSLDNPRATHHLLHLDFEKVKQCLQTEIDELSRNMEDEKESQKATVEKLKEAEKSCEALKKELEGLDAKEYGTKLKVMLICEKAAAAERVAASRQSFKDTSKAKEYQHRKDAIADKVNGLVLARRAGVVSTGFQVQLLEGNQHAPVLNPSVLSAYSCSHAMQPYL